LLASISSATATRVVTDILIASKILTAQNYEKIPILPKELPQKISLSFLFSWYFCFFCLLLHR